MFLIVHTADIHGLGRFETSMLTDQDRMSLFFTPDKAKDARRELEGDEADACSWVGVSCDEDTITRIHWPLSELELVGSINFAMLPPKLEALHLSNQELVGEMNVSCLPETLTSFWVESCLFTGSLDFSTLPSGLEEIVIHENRIQSIANISNLPESLDDFRICEEHLEIDFVEVGKLPNTFLTIKLACFGFQVKVLDEVDKERVCCDYIPPLVIRGPPGQVLF